MEKVLLAFLECFVFTRSYLERCKTLEQLQRKSEEWFYYSILNEQLNSPNVESGKEKELLEDFKQTYGEMNQEFRLMELRRNLLSYENGSEADKEKSIDYLRDGVLHLSFNHPAPMLCSGGSGGNDKLIPSSLDQGIVNFSLNVGELSKRCDFFNSLTPLGKLSLVYFPFSEKELLRFVNSMPSSSFPHCTERIGELLKSHVPFSAMRLQLTRDQLEELGKRHAELLSDHWFIMEYIGSLGPSGEERVEEDEGVQKRYYEKVWELSQRLGVGASGEKLLLMLACLMFEWEHGRVDEERFLSYVSIPQPDYCVYLKPRASEEELEGDGYSEEERGCFVLV